jgi:two-component system, chemotaxis family, chemotaxis protein CheY
MKDLIVIAEDSAPNRKILGHLVEKLGFTVIACEDGASAWAELQKPDQKVMAVISDIMMPNMDGLQLLKNVRESESLKQTPFILITAVSDKDYIVQAKALNVDGYILKPVTFQRVSGKLRELFPGRTFPKIAS